MSAAKHNIEVQLGDKFARRWRVVGADRLLVDLTGRVIRSMCRDATDWTDKIWDFVEDGVHIVNGLTAGTFDLVLTAAETADMWDPGIEVNDGLYDVEAVKCTPTEIVNGSGNTIAFANSTVFGKVTVTALGAAPVVGDVHRISGAEDAANDGSYVVVGTVGGAPANPTTTVWYYTRNVTANAADTTASIKKCVLDEDDVVKLLKGEAQFNGEQTK